MPTWLIAGAWGLVAGSALIIGALVGFFFNLNAKIIASVMAFGSGVLISALSFDLMDEAYKQGGFTATALGFVLGAAIFTGANWIVSRYGARHRKRSGSRQSSETGHGGSGTAIAIGALIDAVPESIVIGISMIESSVVSLIAVIAIFLSNLPEGLSSAAGMRTAGRTKTYVFAIWIGIAVISGISSLLGYVVFSSFSAPVIAVTTAIAAGAILSMIVDTMIPEAFEETHLWSGLVTVTGFITAFFLSKMMKG